jgi:CubicO group peptidase (beta-lactamase class C family)
MTKAVTSVAAMQLSNRALHARRSSRAYLPELANMKVFESFDQATGAYKVRPAASKITIRHLFTHTSGLGYGFTVRSFATSSRARARTIRRARCSSSRDAWIYGTGVDWLGRLVEKLSGKNLEEYFRERIFTPLKMSDTFYNVPEPSRRGS